MTKRMHALIGLLAVCVVAPAVAQQSPLFLGLKVGTLDADLSGFRNTEAAGVMLGYDLHADLDGALALETEFTTTITDGKIGGGGWDADTIAAYVAYRTAQSVYVKAKVGILRRDMNRSGGSGANNGTDSDFAYGAGVGWRINGKAALEIEYALLSGDLSFLSLAYVNHF
jgi:opacity protein-like surface antigen